jgi:hypothetical protein
LLQASTQCDSGEFESNVLIARQHTMLWNEEHCLDVASSQHSTPLNIIYDVYAEELTFPAINYGDGMQFNLDVRVTPFMMATSEIRRSNRRGVTPEHILLPSLLDYSKSIIKIIPDYEPDLATPIIITGDFNVNVMQEHSLLDFMLSEFNLSYIETPPTTLDNTCIDLTFARNLDVSCMTFVSYFSYHRPIINKIIVE